MSIGLARLEGLWCGQGMVNLLKLYHDPDADPDHSAPDMMALFDCGTSGYGLDESRNVRGISPPVETIIKALQLQEANKKTPKLDLVLFSHQDKDHWKLIKDLIKQVEDKEIQLEVGRILYGGASWKESAKKP